LSSFCKFSNRNKVLARSPLENLQKSCLRLQGFVVGFKGSQVFCLHYNSMQALEVPQSASMQGYLAAEDWQNAYKVAIFLLLNSPNSSLCSTAALLLHFSKPVWTVLQSFKPSIGQTKPRLSHQLWSSGLIADSFCNAHSNVCFPVLSRKTSTRLDSAASLPRACILINV